MDVKVVVLILLVNVLGCPYLGGKSKTSEASVLEMYLGSQGRIGYLPSLPSAHQKYSSSDLPSLITDVLDGDYGHAAQQLQAYPKLALEQWDGGGFNALQWAAMVGANNFVELFFNHGSELNPSSQYPPLHLAVMQNHTHTVEKLLSLGAQVTLRSTKGLTPFLHAVDEGHVALAALLISAGADVNDRVLDSSPLQMPALGFASMRGEAGLVELMLENGADRGLLTGHNHTPLIFAAAANHLEVVNLLLKKKVGSSTSSCPASFAKINHKELGKGRSALLWAITGDPSGQRTTVHRSAGRPKVGYTVSKERQVKVEDDHVYDRRQATLVETLLSHGADPNLPDKAGCSALFLAATESHDAVRKIRTHTVATDSIWPPGRPDIVEVLLRGGAIPRSNKNGFGQSVASQDSETSHLIRWAVQRGYHEILRLILFPPPFVPTNAGIQESRVPLDLATISLQGGVSLLGYALSKSAWTIAELLTLGGCSINGINVTPLLEEHKKQLASGVELSPEQIAVHLRLTNISQVVYGKVKNLGLGSQEIRNISEESLFFDQIKRGEGDDDNNSRIITDNNIHEAWVILQGLVYHQNAFFLFLRNTFSFFWS